MRDPPIVDRQQPAQLPAAAGVSIGARARDVERGWGMVVRQSFKPLESKGFSTNVPSRSARWLGIDVGGTKIALAVADAEGRVCARRRRPTEPSGDSGRDLARIAAECRELLAEAGVAPAELAAVGVALPGPIDRARGAVVAPPNLPGWRDVPVREVLERDLGVPVHIENDANAAALAEWRYGAGRGCDDLVYLTMSTGIGGGLVLGGRLYTGLGGNAGEIGHVCLIPDGEPCACGRRGCFEAYAGGASWTRRLRRAAPADGRVAALAGGREHVRPEHLVAAAREGDPWARAELERWNGFVARAIETLVYVLAPQVVVLGTIATAAGDALCFQPVRRMVAERSWPLLTGELRIVPTGLGAELPYLAAACVAIQASGV
jgi:glucokinase